jgi:hypothetical protein
MVHSYFSNLMLTAALGLAACGAPEAKPDSSIGLVLQVHLPSALSRTESRRTRFLARVSRLELQWATKQGKSGSRAFAPGQWDQIALPETGFAAMEGDVLHLTARVWDTSREGVPRLIPALSGRAVLKGGEVARQGPTNIHLKLTLRVPVAEYD